MNKYAIFINAYDATSSGEGCKSNCFFFCDGLPDFANIFATVLFCFWQHRSEAKRTGGVYICKNAQASLLLFTYWLVGLSFHKRLYHLVLVVKCPFENRRPNFSITNSKLNEWLWRFSCSLAKSDTRRTNTQLWVHLTTKPPISKTWKSNIENYLSRTVVKVNVFRLLNRLQKKGVKSSIYFYHIILPYIEDMHGLHKDGYPLLL